MTDGRGSAWMRMAAVVSAVLIGGCGIASSYRPADTKTIRDLDDGGGYVKKVGVVALLNTSLFTGSQISLPFMTAFLERMAADADDADLVVPGRSEVPPFLWNPPRADDGELDVFTLAGLARQEG
ncbi:MAG TPA: hypothetical protein VLT88_09800, partial [Desulfosarcina sp.]|nr:hypothetical protein [Desulfosarcina sp.]